MMGMMNREPFDRSIREQIAANRARTPTERFRALCELLEAVEAISPDDPEAQERRRRVEAQRELDSERKRAFFRRWMAAKRIETGESA
jgi:hypothetical protein